MQLADHFRELVDALSDLIARHLKLAQVELKEDVRAIGIDVGKLAAFVPLVLIGYLLLCVAAALFLNRYMGADLAFLLVGAFNLGVGGLGILLAVRKLKSRQVMNDTRAEIESTAIALSTERQ
ncbi:MAG: hypothetical protein H6Q89_2351 [Myxococcaceae bacterium]|nr:hypothetical protein [Myxococcaceae bacterium]